MSKRSKVGLALGGGSAKGMCYIGILKVLEKHKIPIDYISGTSVGALIGALYCAGYSPDEIEKIVEDLNWRRLFDFTEFRHGLIRGKRIEKLLKKLLKGKTFENLKIPLVVTAVDVHHGEEVVFDSGDLVKAVHASTAIPGVFAPVVINRREYVDGGVMDPVPVGVLKKKGVKKIIAVNLTVPLKRLQFRKATPKEKNPFMQEFLDSGIKNLKRVLKNDHILPSSVLWFLTPKRLEGFSTTQIPPVLKTVLRSYNIVFNEFAHLRMQEHKPDIILSPNVSDVHLFDFHRYKYCIKKGEFAASRRIGEIKKLCKCL